VRERLGWMDKGRKVCFEGRIDIGLSNDPQIKMISLVCNEKEWTPYVRVVIKSEIHGIELVAKTIAWNDVGDGSSRSPTLLKAIDDEHVECGIVLTQLLQETQDDIDTDDPPFDASHETILNVKPVSESLCVDDAIADAGFISGMDPQPTAIGFILDVDPPSIEPKFMPEYEAVLGDERVEDSADD
jgi:hypothetical protein